MSLFEPPYYPIVYVRGYAMTPGEIQAATASPYMGFNEGSTKIRQDWEKKPRKLLFESPLIRLMKDHGYQDVYRDGAELEGPLPPRCVVIHRYYDAADKDFGSGRVPTIRQAAEELVRTLRRLRDQVCQDQPAARADFRVHLVAHSMGGLIVAASSRASPPGKNSGGSTRSSPTPPPTTASRCSAPTSPPSSASTT